MSEILKPKYGNYDLEERTYEFSRRVLKFTKNLIRDIENNEIRKQLVRSACSVGANYIEANESLGKKDFLMRLRISKKEAKKTIYWLRLCEPNYENIEEKNKLIQESTELMKIFGAILEKSK